MSKSSKTHTTKIEPLFDKVLLREVKAIDLKTKSGIILPESANPDKDTNKGEVVAVGPGRYDDGKLIPMHVRVGDTVIYSWGDKMKIDGEEYTIVSESNISAIIK